MKLIKQKLKSNCGQIALSLVTGVKLRIIYKLIKHKSYTTTKELVNILKKLNYDCPNKLKCLKQIPELCVAKLSFSNKKNWHWIVIYKNNTYDGIYGKNADYSNIGKITSFLPITKNN